MSRATVRGAVATHLTGGVVAGLSTVHSAKPRRWKPSELTFDGTRSSSAHGYVHVESVVERRAASGKKFLEYTVAVVLHFRTRHTGTTGGQDAMGDLDVLLDAVKARLRVKPPVLGGADAAIFDCCETLLEDEADLPQDEAAGQSVWCVVRFDVDEMITA